MSVVAHEHRTEESARAAHLFRHKGPVTCVAAVPHTRYAVTSGYDGAVGLFDLENETSSLLGYHKHLVNRIVVDDAGSRAASSSSDYTVCIWDLEARRPALVLRGHSDDVEDFVFIDESTGASVSRDRRIIIWNLETGAPVRIIHEHAKDVLSVAYADGKLYSSGDDKTLRQWDVRTGAPLKMWGPFEQETDTCAIDPINKRAVLGCDDGCIRIFDIDDGTLLETVEAHASGIKKVAVSPASGDILSAAYDQRIVVWDAGDLRQKVELEKLPAMWERSLNWSPDGTRIMAGTFDGTIAVWDAASGKMRCEIGDKQEGNACFNDVAAGTRGEIVAVSDDGFIRTAVLTAQDAQWTQRYSPATGRVLSNAVTLDDAHRLVVTGTHNHRLHIFRKAADGLVDEREVALGEGPINCLRVAHNAGYDGDIFAACYSSAIVRVSPQGIVRGKINLHEGAVKSLRIHPRRPLGVSCGADNLLLSWTLDGQLVERFLGHTAIVDDVDIDPSGTRIASVSRDFTLKIYDISTGRLQHSIDLGHRSPKCVCFHTDTEVYVGDYWGALIKADLLSGKNSRHQIARNGISSLAQSGPDLVAASYDGNLYLVRPGDMTVARTLNAMTQRSQESAFD